MIATIVNLFAGKPSPARERLREAQVDLAAKSQRIADLETAVAPLRKIREAADDALTAQSCAERSLADKREELQLQHKYGDRHLADLIEAARAAAKVVEATQLEAFRSSEDLAATEHELREAKHAAGHAERAISDAAKDVVVDEAFRALEARVRTSAAQFIADRDALRAACYALERSASKESVAIPDPEEVTREPLESWLRHERSLRLDSQLGDLSRPWRAWLERLRSDSDAQPE